MTSASLRVALCKYRPLAAKPVIYLTWCIAQATENGYFLMAHFYHFPKHLTSGKTDAALQFKKKLIKTKETIYVGTRYG